MNLHFTFFHRTRGRNSFPKKWSIGATILFITLGFSLTSKAQNIQWDQSVGGDRRDYFVTAEQTQDGGYILGGRSGSGKTGDKTEANKGGYDIWIVKLNANGSKAWDKSFGGTSTYEELQSLHQTPDGGYILLFNFGRLIKLNKVGSTTWEKTLDNESYGSLRTLELTSDGGYILGGYHRDYNYSLLKLNSNGSVAWEESIAGKAGDKLNAVQQTPDGGYIVGGLSGSGFTTDENEATGFWLVKLNANRTKAWDNRIGFKKFDGLVSLRATPDGGYILGGHADTGTSSYKTDRGKGSFDYWLVKLKADGSKDWDKVIGGNSRDLLHSLQPTTDGGYILGGSSYSGISGDKTQAAQGAYDYWIVKLKADQSIAWDLTLGGSKPDGLETIFQTKDGGYFVGGSSDSETSASKTKATKGQEDYWVVKINNNTRKKQTITLESVSDINYPTQKSITLSAKVTSGLPVTYNLVSGPATIKSNVLTLTSSSGTVTVSASQAGDENYLPAPNDTIRFVVQVPPITRLWDKAYGGVATQYYSQYTKFYGSSTLSAIVATPDGGHIFGGTSDSNKGNDKTQPTRGKSDYWIVKVDAQGNKQWDKTFGGKDSDGLKALIPTPDGGYLLGGSSNSAISGDKSENRRGTPTPFGFIPSDYWIVKVDKDGNKQWDKTFGGIDDDDFTSLVATADGGYLLGGFSDSDKGKDKTEARRGKNKYADYWVVKVDAQGNKQWDKTIGGKAQDQLNALMLTPDGGYLLGGSSYSDKGDDKSEDNRNEAGTYHNFYFDYWVVKLNANGTKVWDKTYGGLNNDELTTITATPDGNFLLGGKSNSLVEQDKTAPNKGKDDFWLIQMGANGIKLWDKTFGGSESDQLTAIISTPDGGYLLGGTSTSGISGDKSEPNRGGRYTHTYGLNDYWLVKVDNQGQKLWDRTFGTYTTQYNDVYSLYPADQLAALSLTSDGSYLVGGTTYNGISGDKSQSLKGVQDFWVIKIKEENAPQALVWDMRFGTISTDNLTSVIKTSDDGYLVGGYTDWGINGDKAQAGQGENDYWIVKTDKNGKKLWDKRFGSYNNDYLKRVIQTSDGGYLLAGSTTSGRGGDKTELSRGDRDYWIVKVDAQGNQQWDKRYGGSGYDELEKVIQLSTGEYVLGGFSNSPASGDKSQDSQGNTDYWLLKITSTGIKIWDKRYGGTNKEILGSFTETTNGNLLLAGTSFSSNSGDKSQARRGDSDFWAVQIDKDGNKLWDKSYGGSEDDQVASVIRNQDNTFIIAGTSDSPANGTKSQASQGSRDYWVIKIDSNGKLLWDKTYGGTSTDDLKASTSTRDGGYVLAGSSSSPVSGDKSQDNQGGYSTDFWIVKVDAQGNKQYDKRFGGNEEEELRTIFQTNDGGLLLGGRSGSGVSGDRTQPSQGGTDYWLVKLAPETSSIVATREATPVEEPVTLTNTLTAYPNPFQGRVTVSFTLPQTQAAMVKIFDGQGREVTTLFQGEVQAKQTYQLEWQSGNKPAGLYFLQLQTSTLRQQQKLLLTK